MDGRFAGLWSFPVGDYGDEAGCGQESLVLWDYRDVSEARPLVPAATIPKDLLSPGPFWLEWEK